MRDDSVVTRPQGLPNTRLPPSLTSLVGRDDESAAICAMLRRPATRLLTLTGPGGIGKTRLAMHVAAQLASDFADGVWFVPLAAISDPELVAETIAQTMGVAHLGSRPAAELLAAFLRERHLLLLLDNFEQVLDAAPLISDLLLAAEQLTVLVTSRASLRLSPEYEYPVPPLVPWPAVQLFAERAQALDPSFTLTEELIPTITAICEQLDGLPLAIELAAVRSKLFAPQALLRRLDKRLDLLHSGSRDLPARQQTLRATIA
ncbi:MAG: AAA family ATPase, partial [Chloroflexaceae bacterium]|nr:AAA family ATPase [Chloroflexaceae bacterium]